MNYIITCRYDGEIIHRFNIGTYNNVEKIILAMNKTDWNISYVEFPSATKEERDSVNALVYDRPDDVIQTLHSTRHMMILEDITDRQIRDDMAHDFAVAIVSRPTSDIPADKVAAMAYAYADALIARSQQENRK